MRAQRLSLHPWFALSLAVAVAATGARAAPAPRLSLTLQEAVARGLEHAPELSEARHEQRAAEALSDAAVKATLPSLKFEALAAPSTPLPVLWNGGAVSSDPNGPSLAYLAQIEQPLYTGGRLSATAGAAHQIALARQHSTQTAQIVLTAAIRDACYELLRAQALRVAATEATEIARQHRTDAEARHRAGLVATVEKLRAQVRVKEAETDELQAITQARMASSSLAVLLGVPVESELVLQNHFPAPRAVPKLDVPKALSARPDLLTAQAQAQAEEERIHNAAADFYPSLSAYVAAGQIDTVGWQAGVRLSWDVFSWGKTRAEVAAANESAQAAREREHLAQDHALIEIRRAELAMQTAADSIALAREREGAAKEELELSRGRFAQGHGTGTEVLDAHARLTRARAALIDAQADYAKARNRLWLVTGADRAFDPET